MTHITFSLFPDLKGLFVEKCGAISQAKILRGLVRAFITGKIKIKDLDLE